MNQLLHSHGCLTHYNIPEGLKELMSDITREVLREQPKKLFTFIANYLSILLVTRENTMIAHKVLDDLCDCKPLLEDHLIQVGLTKGNAILLSNAIKREVEKVEPVPGEENAQETLILKRILKKTQLDEETISRVSKIAIDTYRDYWYKKKTMELFEEPIDQQSWEKAVERTVEIYKGTKPSMVELNRAREQIEAAYHYYHRHRTTLRHLIEKQKVLMMKEDKPKDKLHVLVRRLDKRVNVELGSMMSIQSKEDRVQERQLTGKITHILNDEEDNYAADDDVEKSYSSEKKKKNSGTRVSVAYTQVDIRPQFGITEPTLGSHGHSGDASVVNISKSIEDGAGDNKEIIPEIMELNEGKEDYDRVEDFSDTSSGPSTQLHVTALDTMLSDIEEDFQ